MTSSDQPYPTQAPAQAEGQPRSGRWRAIALTLLALLVLSIATIGYLSVQLSRSASDRDREAEVTSAVRKFATQLTTYDHSTVQKDISEVLSLSTGSFQKEYKDVLGGDEFQQALVKAKGASEGEVVSIYISDLTEDRADAIVVLDQTVTNQEDTQPKTERRRLEVTLVKTRSGWKADRVSVL